MNYVPDPSKLRLWDTWVYVAEDGQIHLFFLAHEPGGPGEYVGHAVSRDWLHWEDLPVIRVSGNEGDWDAGPIGTGMVFRYDDGRYYMTYTAAFYRDQCHGLMVSDDLMSWEKPTDGPVWQRAKQPPYERDGNRISLPAWRDSFVTRNPSGQWEAVCCGHVDTGPPAGRGCLARCRLDAIDRWVDLPPLAATGRYTAMEVPEIFSFHGRHWVIFSTGCGWGVRLDTPQRPVPAGTFYLSADSWDGPYQARPDNILIGAGHNRMDAYVARTVEYEGQRLVYHHYGGEAPATFGFPKRLDAEGDRLILRPWDGLRRLWQQPLELDDWEHVAPGPVSSDVWQVEGDVIMGDCEFGASALYSAGDAHAVDIEAEVVIRNGARAGLLTGLSAEPKQTLLACLLDASSGEVTIGQACTWEHGSGPNLSGILDTCRRTIEYGRPYRLRLIQRNRFAELYVDDELVFSTVTGLVPAAGGIGCTVESAQARFHFVRAHAIEPNNLLSELT